MKLMSIIKNQSPKQYQEFMETKFENSVVQEFEQKPYHVRYRLLYMISIISSYLFNFLSALTGFFLIFMFLFGITNQWLIAIITTCSLLMILEFSKRTLARNIMQDWLKQSKVLSFQSLFLLILICVSILLSYKGGEKLVLSNPQLTNFVNIESEVKPLEAKINQINKEIKIASQNTWKGKITSSGQKTIQSLSDQKLLIEQQILQTKNRSYSRNDKAQNQLEINAFHFGLITIFSEIFLLISICYICKYRFIAYLNFVISPENNRPTSIPNYKNKFSDNNNRNNKIQLQNNRPRITKNRKITEIPTQKETTRTNVKLDNNKHEVSANNTKSDEEKNIQVDSNDDSLLKKMKQLRSKINVANHRIKNGIGKPSTSIHNIEKYSKELNELEGKLQIG